MSSLALPFLRELGYVLLQRHAADRFSLLSDPPGWFSQIWGSPSSRNELDLGEKSPFLQNFLLDAEAFWAAPQSAECKSGLWIEKAESGNEVPLVASALILDSQPILALFSPGSQYSEQVQTLQAARSSLLQHEKLLREIQKKEILLHCIIHDLSQPLSVMSVAFDCVQKEQMGEQAAQFMELGKRASQQQEAMIREVLAAFSTDLRSTLEAEKSINTSPDLLKVAEEAVASQYSPFQAKKVGLALSRPRGTGVNFRVNGEETRLGRVFSNLLENALRYSPAEGNVIIKLTDEGDFLKVSIEDEGPGLPPELQPAQIFELFSKGKEGAGKAGLGLYFCRITVERWGGTIGCESLEKKGARFWFRLPWSKARESSDGKADSLSVESLPMKKTNAPRGSLQILFADDQEDIRTVTAFRLQQSGHVVSLASNGESALQASRQQRFHVILLDEEMPLMNGVEVVRAIRQDYTAEKERPIFIAITGNNTPEDVERLIAAGFDSVIGKPFRIEALQQRLQELPQSAGKSSANPTAENRGAQFAGSAQNSVNLLERMGGDLKLLGRVASTFLRDLPGRMSAIQIAIERKDARALAHSAHALKGSAGIFGATAVRQHAQSLEDFGKKGELSGAVAAFVALKEEIANLEENLRGYAQQTGGKPSSKPRKGSRQANSGKHST